MPFQLYDEFAPKADGDLHVMGNNFVATKEWFDGNEDLATAFLELWQTGVEMWQEQKADVVRRYPQHFSVESDEDVEYMVDFLSQEENDWFVDNVFLDSQEWVDTEIAIWDIQKGLHPENANYLAPDAPQPEFTVLQPAS
jgi:hypothetical protein